MVSHEESIQDMVLRGDVDGLRQALDDALCLAAERGSIACVEALCRPRFRPRFAEPTALHQAARNGNSGCLLSSRIW